MNDGTVRFVVSLNITAGKIDAFERTMKEMIAGTEGEAATVEYDFYISADRTKCRLIEKYLDANAMVAHMTGPVVQSLVPKLLESCSIAGFEVYGEPGAKGREVLATVGAEVFGYWKGLGR